MRGIELGFRDSLEPYHANSRREKKRAAFFRVGKKCSLAAPSVLARCAVRAQFVACA
jgi:hypothetical protein